VAGRDFQNPTPEQPAQISLEKRFADRLQLQVGDKLDFDVQGVTVSGEVVNLRKVRWTSFQPNFFIQFQSGYLEEAPKTHLMTLGPSTPEIKSQLQIDLARQFPNISLLDVSRVVERLSGIMNQMSMALQVMAVFCMLVGLFILFTVSHHQMHERRKDVNLLKVLGANFHLIRKIYITEFMLIISFAVLFGTTVSYLLSIVLSWQLFDSSWLPPWIEPLLIATLLPAIAYGLILYVIQNVLRTKPQELLQSF
jgi:putative ABC transport system permease protein